jgi:hypothetical protein
VGSDVGLEEGRVSDPQHDHGRNGKEQAMSQMKVETPEERKAREASELAQRAKLSGEMDGYKALLAELTGSVQRGIDNLTAPGTRKEKHHLESVLRAIRQESVEKEPINLFDDL